MSERSGPLLTHELAQSLHQARDGGASSLVASFDLGRSQAEARIAPDFWELHGQRHPYPPALRERTVFVREGGGYAPLQHYGGSLIKLVPTPWGAPTFEIDGIKMLPTAQVSPYEDARRKVALVQPRGRVVLDTCGGLGYFAACSLEAGAVRVQSFEKNPDVLWLRRHNPWSPDPDDPALGGRLQLTHADVAQAIAHLPDAAFDAGLHDPPRFGIAGDLYSLDFYRQLARVLKPHAPLFHYTGTPNAKTRGRDLPGEVMKRLQQAGFRAERALDGVFATRLRTRR